MVSKKVKVKVKVSAFDKYREHLMKEGAIVSKESEKLIEKKDKKKIKN